MSQIKKKFIEDNAIDNTKLDQSSEYDFATNNGTVKVKTPVEETDAVNKDYVDDLFAAISIREVEDLTYSDSVNKVIALSHIPTVFEDVLFFPYEGSAQEYGVDFTISVKENISYLCLSPDSTPPSGGIWDVQNLPTTGIMSIIQLNEGFTCEYLYNGSVLASPTPDGDGAQGPQGPTGPQGPAAESGSSISISNVTFTSANLTNGIYTLSNVQAILPTILTDTNEQVLPDSLNWATNTYTIDLSSFNVNGTWKIYYVASN